MSRFEMRRDFIVLLMPNDKGHFHVFFALDYNNYLQKVTDVIKKVPKLIYCSTNELMKDGR